MCTGKPGCSKAEDLETLRVLLKHWVEHNRAHEESLREWAKKVRNMGGISTAGFIEKAADHLSKACEKLLKAGEDVREG